PEPCASTNSATFARSGRIRPARGVVKSGAETRTFTLGDESVDAKLVLLGDLREPDAERRVEMVELVRPPHDPALCVQRHGVVRQEELDLHGTPDRDRDLGLDEQPV